MAKVGPLRSHADPLHLSPASENCLDQKQCWEASEDSTDIEPTPWLRIVQESPLLYQARSLASD